jgi:hypothetical protein
MASERPEKKDKKEKKEKRSDDAGVAKSKKDKKEKKDKKDKLASALDEKLQQDVAAQTSAKASEEASDMDEDNKPQAEQLPLERKVVPFAVPLADEKGQKKICKTIRKGTPPLSHSPPLCFFFPFFFVFLFMTSILFCHSSVWLHLFLLGSPLLT